MPSYSNTLPPSSIGFGETQQVVNSTDTIYPAPYKSAQIAVAPNFSTGLARLSAEIAFSGAPGAFQANIQTADTDADGSYVNEGANISTVNAGNVARLEVSGVVAKFARIYITTLTNNVTATAKLSA